MSKRLDDFYASQTVYSPGLCFESRAANMRLNGDVLEQAHVIRRYASDGSLMEREVEWRPVPRVDAVIAQLKRENAK